MRDVAENILVWFSAIRAAFKKPIGYFSGPARPESDIAIQTRDGSAAEEAGAADTATKSVAADPPPKATFTTAITADGKNGQEARVRRVVPVPTDQQEIERRRALVRTFFNDFWSDRDDKPAAFVDRLDQAETFLNDRLTACGEHWQLDGQSRKILGLPPRSNSRNNGNGTARPI
jgi:hypothetical protein